MGVNLPRIVISAPSSGSGKTVITCGILSALKKRCTVSAFKCGPDYIDTMFHERAIGVSSKNLDSYFCDGRLLTRLFYNQAKNADISIIEGVMGYYDGLSFDSTRASTYDIAKILSAPTLLVVNARGMSYTVLAQIKGLKEFRQDSGIQAVILNNVSEYVYKSLKRVIEDELDVKVIGYLPKLCDCGFESRHLGLVTPKEVQDIDEKINKIADVAEQCIDLDELIKIANSAEKISIDTDSRTESKNIVRLAVARDKAFCFYYKDNIDLLKELGCDIVPFSPIEDKGLPQNIDGLIIGGGYPELYCRELSDNRSMMSDIKTKIENGLPCLAECGGFMYLHKEIEDMNGQSYDMVGIVDAVAKYMGKLVRFGYINISANCDSFLLDRGESIKAHEFHYWDSTNNGNIFNAKKPIGNRSWDCMYKYKNTVCGYPHVFYQSNPSFAKGFVDKCAEFKGNRQC